MKNKFNELLRSTGIKGIENLISELESKGFYETPASTSHHSNGTGGLLEHSLNVYDIAAQIPMARSIKKEDVIIATLLHDVGKMGAFGEQMYEENYLASGKRSVPKPWVVNKSIIIEHQDLSLMIINRYIELTRDQAIAIKFHNGLYTPDGRTINGKETKLMMILHFADMWASRVVEV